MIWLEKCWLLPNVKLHKAGSFRELLDTNPDINEGLCPLPRLSRETMVRLSKLESALVHSLKRDQFLVERVESGS